MGLNEDKKADKPLALSKPGTVGGYPYKYRGLDVAQRIIENAKSGKTLVYYDPDVDGLIAGLFITQVLTKLGISRKAHANSNRAHGFLLRDDEYQGWTVFNGDFLVPRSKVKGLVDNGTSILSLDHHELEDEGLIHEVGLNGSEGIVINNQYEWEDPDNHYQSGAGVTFEVLREIYPFMDTPTNRALVGMTLLTDIRNIHNERAAGYLWELYNHKYEGYIHYLINKAGTNAFQFGVPRATRNYIDFGFAPKINSILRFNEEDKAVKFILGGGYPEGKYQERQKEFVKELMELAEITEYSNLKVIHIDQEAVSPANRAFYSNFIGLLCSRFSGSGHSVIGYATDMSGKVVRTSFRGSLQDTEYRTLSQGIVDGRGHEIAFGVVGLNPTPETFEALNEACRKAEENTNYKQRYISVSNLNTFLANKGSLLADYNNYRMSSDRVHIQYTGEGAVVQRSGPKYTEYLIDGHAVMCFDKSLTIEEDYIVVSLNRKQVDFVLQERWNEKYAQQVRIGDIDLTDNWWRSL